MSVCVCKLICNLCKEHCMLENSCVTASFPFLSSLLFFLFSISIPHWAISHTAGCVAASATPHADVPGSADGQHPELCLLLRYQLFLFKPHFLSPFMTLVRHKSGLQMTRFDRGEMANTPRQLERVMVRTSKEMCRLVWRRAYVDSCAGLQVWTELQTVETFRDSMNMCEAEVIKGAESRSVAETDAGDVAWRLM